LTAIGKHLLLCDDEFYYPKYTHCCVRLNKTLLLPDC
jgi:hypothetical protein